MATFSTYFSNDAELFEMIERALNFRLCRFVSFEQNGTCQNWIMTKLIVNLNCIGRRFRLAQSLTIANMQFVNLERCLHLPSLRIQ